MVGGVVEAKLSPDGNGAVLVRFEGHPAGAFIDFQSQIDSILFYVARELEIDCVSDVGTLADIPSSSVSRVRHGKASIPISWLARLHDLSGIPLDELRMVGCLQREVMAHEKARVI